MPLPGGYGTIARIGLVGHDCASAWVLATARARIGSNVRQIRFMTYSGVSFSAYVLTGIADGCARAASGHTAAPPRTATTARRFMGFLPHHDSRATTEPIAGPRSRFVSYSA